MRTHQFTFTDRFKKHFKKLSTDEKKQLMNKLELLSENLRLERSASKAHLIYLNAA